MGFLDNVKDAAQQAAVKAKEGVEEVQAKRELSQAYGDLGRAAHRLIASGEISHPQLTALADRVSRLESPDEGAVDADAQDATADTPA